MAPLQSRKRSLGRRKIAMKLIADENARTVTFSKRRAGLFKKATELSILCGTQIALIIFSMGGRAYSFGHPTVEYVLDRFLNKNPTPNLQDSAHGMKLHAATVQQLKQECDDKTEQLEKKKKKGKELDAALKRSKAALFSEEHIDSLNWHQLNELKQKLVEFRESVTRYVNSQNASPDVPRESVDVEEDIKEDPPCQMSSPNVGLGAPRNVMDVAGPSRLKKFFPQMSSPDLGHVASQNTVDVAGPSRPRKVLRLMSPPNVGLGAPRKVMDVAGPSVLRKVDLSRLSCPSVGLGVPRDVVDVAGPSVPRKALFRQMSSPNVGPVASRNLVDFAGPLFPRKAVFRQMSSPNVGPGVAQKAVDVAGPSVPRKAVFRRMSFPNSGLGASQKAVDVAGPSVPRKAVFRHMSSPNVGLGAPQNVVDVAGPSVPKQVDLHLMSSPTVGLGAPGNAVDVAGPSVPKKIDLANLEKDGASPIPADWLKL